MRAAKLSLAAALFAVGLLCSYLLPEGRAEQPALLRLAAGGGLAAVKPTVRTVGATKTAAEQPAERAPAIDDEDEPTPGLGGTPEFRPRAPDEWQGMLVDVGFTPMCEESARCGLARACQEGQCMPCSAGGACAAGETCVLDHCVLESRVECRTRRDCAGEDVFCVLTGYTPDPRGNAGMRAVCLSSQGGKEAEAVEPNPGEPAPTADLVPHVLLDAVHTHARAHATR